MAKEDELKDNAHKVSSYANAAFATLADPIKRAEYLMQVLSRDGENT